MTTPTSTDHDATIVIREGSPGLEITFLLGLLGMFIYLSSLMIKQGQDGLIVVLAITWLVIAMIVVLRRREFILTGDTLTFARRSSRQTIALKELAGIGLRPQHRGSPLIVFWNQRNADLVVTPIPAPDLALLLGHLRKALPALQVDREVERYLRRGR